MEQCFNEGLPASFASFQTKIKLQTCINIMLVYIIFPNKLKMSTEALAVKILQTSTANF